MPKHFYCLLCGIELTHSRKAIPGKGIILDLITPHECEGYSVKSNIDENPTVEEVIEKARTVHLETVETEIGRITGKGPSNLLDGDLRKEVKTSTAPDTLLRNLNTLENSEPSGKIE